MSIQMSTQPSVTANAGAQPSPRIIPHEAGSMFDMGGFGIHWKIDGADAGKHFAVVHHPIAPHALAAPLHRHHREDEYSYVLSGRMGALLGDDVVFAEAGSWVFKPRAQWHTFWNAGDSPCEIIEIISPAGFEDCFREVATIWPDMSKAGPILEKYQIDMDPDSVPGLCQRFGLTAFQPTPKMDN
jgi:mannose-6-phosphate isomerase-like protein (cupin superfamily)